MHQRVSFWDLLNALQTCHVAFQLSFEFLGPRVDIEDCPTGLLFTTGVELHFSFSQRCQTLKCVSRCHCVVPNQTKSVVFFFFEFGSPAKSLSTKNVILSTCSCHRNRIAALGFPKRYRAARFSGNTRILAVHSPLSQRFCGFRKVKSAFGQIGKRHARRSVSCCMFFPQNFFRLTPTCLVVSLVVYPLSWCSRFFVMRNVCLKSGSQCPRIVQFDLPRF